MSFGRDLEGINPREDYENRNERRPSEYVIERLEVHFFQLSRSFLFTDIYAYDYESHLNHTCIYISLEIFEIKRIDYDKVSNPV